MSLPTTFANISFPVILTTPSIQRSLTRPATYLPCCHALPKPFMEVLMNGSISVDETSTEAHKNSQYDEKLPVFLLLHQKPSVCDRSSHLCADLAVWLQGRKQTLVSASLRGALVFMKLNSLTFLCILRYKVAYPFCLAIIVEQWSGP